MALSYDLLPKDHQEHTGQKQQLLGLDGFRAHLWLIQLVLIFSQLSSQISLQMQGNIFKCLEVLASDILESHYKKSFSHHKMETLSN